MINEEISQAGIIIVVLTWAIVGLEIGVNKYCRKVTNTYWFWLTWSLFYIIYCICICWKDYWNLYAHIDIPTPSTDDWKISSLISKAFMLNLCPLLNFLLPVSLIADPSRKAARSFAPIAILTSSLNLFFSILRSDSTELTWQYIFLGTSGNLYPDLFYFGHAMNLFLAVAIMLNTPRLGWKGLVGTYGALGGMYLYIVPTTYATGCLYECAGVRPLDFSGGGSFSFIAKLINDKSGGVHSMIVFFFGLIIILFGIIMLLDACNRGYLKFGDKYSGCWWRWYDYNKTTIKEPWGWFSHNWQLKHHKVRKSIK